jgi:uncharacterized protein (DUF1778 family)
MDEKKDENRLPLSHRPGRRRSGTETRRKTRLVNFRATEDERAALESLARAEGLTLGSYIRSTLLPRAKTLSRRRPRVDEAAIAKLYGNLNRIGNNINQIARAMNEGQVREAAALERMENEFITTLKAARLALGYNA